MTLIHLNYRTSRTPLRITFDQQENKLAPDKKRYKKTKYNHTEVVHPYWAKAFPNGYNETNMPNINEWEEFQNWMRPAAFDKQTKLIRKH